MLSNTQTSVDGRLSKKFIAKTRQMHGFTITYQWVNEEPAMCILRNFNGRKSSFVICLSSAYKYLDDDYMIGQAMIAAGHFGMHGEKQAAFNIAKVISECMDDLVKMKPEHKDAVEEREGKAFVPEWDAQKHMIVLH